MAAKHPAKADLVEEIARDLAAAIDIGRTARPKRADRRAHGTWRKADDWSPTTPEQFIIGGMAKLEYIAGQQARDAAIKHERELWLPQLEQWLAESDDGAVRTLLEAEIKRLRRIFGIRPSPDEVRRQVRDRVRRHRASA